MRAEREKEWWYLQKYDVDIFHSIVKMWKKKDFDERFSGKMHERERESVAYHWKNIENNLSFG